MNQNEKMLREGSFIQLVAKLSIPAIIITLVLVIYNVADIYFIGQTNDPNQIAAVSLSTPLFTLLSGFGTLFGSGGTILISTALGANEKDKIKKISSTSFYISMICGVLIGLFVILCTPSVANILGADASTIEYTTTYLRIISLGCGFAIVNTAFGNIIRADGSAIMSMIANVVGSISNIILDALFIIYMGMGVKGAALATLIANILSFLLIVYYICRKQDTLSIHPKYLKFNVFKIIAFGFPMACSNLLMTVSDTFSNNLMMNYGSVALSAQSCASKISLIIVMTTMGLVLGLQPAFAYSFGAQNRKRLYELSIKSIATSVIVGSLLSVICFFYRESLVSIFINDAQVISLGKTMIIAAIIAGPFSGIFYVCQTLLQTTSNIKPATLVSLLDKFIIMLPVLYISNYFLGMIGIAWTKSISMILSTLVAAFLATRAYRKLEF